MNNAEAALLAQFSRAAYGDYPHPAEWYPLDSYDYLRSNGSFSASVYRREYGGNEQIVIAFRGSGFDLGDWDGANRALAGRGNDWDYQFQSALNLTEAVKRDHGDATILVTGHSLGGALAQVAAAMFGLNGATFDPAGAANVVDSDEFNALAQSWNIPSEEEWTPGVEFTNFVVSDSIVGPITGPNVGISEFISNDSAFINVLSTISRFSAELGPLIELVILYELHSIVGITEYMNARSGGLIAEQFTGKAQNALVAAQNGDFGISNQVVIGGVNAWFGSDDSNYLFGDNGDDTIQAYAGDDQILAYAGNDTIDAGLGNDFVSAAQGNDVINAGEGNDKIYAGSGDDVVNAGSGDDSVDGGAGQDMLTIDASAANGAVGALIYVVTPAGGSATTLDYRSTYDSVRSTMAQDDLTIKLQIGDLGSVTWTGIESTRVTGINNHNFATSADLLILQGLGDEYHGGSQDGGYDTFYANWSAATADITWLNNPVTIATVNGVSVSGLERLLLQTGSGNDLLVNTTVNTPDVFITGAGNDTIKAGAGDDRIEAGSGDDVVNAGSGDDSVDGGAGIDVATYGTGRAGATFIATTMGYTVTPSSKDGTDVVANIERLQFSDISVALDIDGKAGTVAKILGAVFGKVEVTNEVYAGIGLYYIDGGMTYESLIQLAIDARLGDGASHQAVVDLLYTNVVGVPPGDADRDYFVGLLDSNDYTVASLGVMAADIDLNVVNINLAGLAQQGLEYVPYLEG